MTGPAESPAPRRYPNRPVVAVGGLVWKGPDLLMIKRAKPPRAGQWSLPGGGQELGETLEEALCREVREETNVEIEVLGLVAAVDSIDRDENGRVRYHYTLIDYAARWLSGEPRPGPEEMDAAWIPPDRLATLDLWSVTRQVIDLSRTQFPGIAG